MARSRRLLSSIHELKQEAREFRPQFEHLTSLWTSPYEDWPAEELQRTHEQVMKGKRSECEVATEFVEARDNPHYCFCGLEKDYGRWREYMNLRILRCRWGEYLRSNMEWDWDTGSCLKHLFKIEKPLRAPVNVLATFEPSDGARDRDIMEVSIAGAHATMPDGIRIPYEDELGRTWYRTFYSCPSVDDIPTLGSLNVTMQVTQELQSLVIHGKVRQDL